MTDIRIPARMAGRTAVVTGGASGIGEAIARRFAAEGARVVVVDRDGESARGVAASLTAPHGLDHPAVEADVAREDNWERVVAAVPGGGIDILVNNAGIAHVGTVETTTVADFERVWRVNAQGVFLGMRAVVPIMVAQGGGVLLNLASIAATLGIRDRFAYSATKGAVLSMTLSVARDYVGKGIRCNCLCPARVHTPFVDGFLARDYPGREVEMMKTLSEYQPIGRMGRPDEIAALAAFLCSDEAAFITGSAVDIDGGVTRLR